MEQELSPAAVDFPTLLEAVLRGQSLTTAQAEAVMEAVLEDQLSDAQLAGLLVALRMKGETVGELVGFARAMRRHARPLTHLRQNHTLIVDTCGTGGDGQATVNISTAAAFVIAAAGLRVAKHGNRSISSRCGSADVLEALGVDVERATERAEQTLAAVGIAFLYAPAVHPAMRRAMRARRELGVRTAFNLLGPLTNPVGADVQVAGVFSPAYLEPMAHALAALGVRRAFVVHGADGTDEISVCTETRVAKVDDGQVSLLQLAPEDFGLERSPQEELRGGDAVTNAQRLRAVLGGERGAARNAVVANAAAALVAAGLAGDFRAGACRAAQLIDSGAAAAKLEAFLASVAGAG